MLRVLQVLRIVLMALLLCQSSGLLAFAEPESCDLTSQDTRHDRQCCSTSCARCVCCAQAVVTTQPFLLVALETLTPGDPVAGVSPLSAVPADILHVPKRLG